MKKFIVIMLLIAAPASAEKLSLDAVSSYFNAMTSAEAAFIQNSDDGNQSSGRMYIKRPGRIRFEYDPPNLALVVVGGGQVAVFAMPRRLECWLFHCRMPRPWVQWPRSPRPQAVARRWFQGKVGWHKSLRPRTSGQSSQYFLASVCCWLLRLACYR